MLSSPLFSFLSPLSSYLSSLFSLLSSPHTARCINLYSIFPYSLELPAIAAFNTWMIHLARNDSEALPGYVDWLWPRSCCFPPERGGLFCDANGHTGCLRPYAVNEMSMMAYYHELNASEMEYLPVFPPNAHVKQRKHMNVTEYTAGGALVGPATGKGIWYLIFHLPLPHFSDLLHMNDITQCFICFLPTLSSLLSRDSGSYGQYIGGTPRYKGKNKGFIDFFHIIGQVIAQERARPSLSFYVSM